MDYSISEISNIVAPIAEKYGVKKVFLFGSRARGDYREDSDYDFSIDPGELTDYFEYMSFVEELESVFGKVNVVSKRTLREDGFYQNMIADEILIYDSETVN